MNEIRNEDGIKAISSFDDKSIDLLLTDVPYSTSKGKENIVYRKALNRNKKYPLRTHFGSWDNDQDYNAWLRSAIPKVKGWIIIWCGYRQFSDFYSILEENGFVKRGMYIWLKTGGFGASKHGFLPFCDIAVVGKRPGAYFMEGNIPNYGRHNLPKGTADRRGDKIHPTQKPLTLFEDLIFYTTKEDDLVVDCFAGSGTTNVACHYLGRNCISYETDEEFYDDSLRRLKRHKRISKSEERKKIIKRYEPHIPKNHTPSDYLKKLLLEAGIGIQKSLDET